MIIFTAVECVQHFGYSADWGGNNIQTTLISSSKVWRQRRYCKASSSTYGTKAFDVCYLSRPTGKLWPKFGKTLVEGYPYIESG